MFNIILYQPEIPPNTGNVIRMSANAGARLHLIRPIAFDLDEKAVRRAGMDYAELAHVEQWDSLGQCLTAIGSPRWFAISTRGTTPYSEPRFAAGDAFANCDASTIAPVLNVNDFVCFQQRYAAGCK